METIRFAVIGAGSFARWAVAEFIQSPGVKLTGVFDEQHPNALMLQALNPSIQIYPSLEILLADPEIDLVYIGTPPYLHAIQSKAALLAGKHVICEKPAALALEDAIELRDISHTSNFLYVVNLMQRYNPLYAAVQQLISQNILGGFLHGFFENYASDEFLNTSHWFWDPSLSGGIFIEHGVHFFDMFNGWLGKGEVVASQIMNRSGYPDTWDKFQSIVRHGDGLVNFYHGFDQPKAMDRQELRLQFERGEITLFEWVPTQLKMTALVSQEGLDNLKKTFPAASIQFIESHDQPVTVSGKFKSITFQFKIHLDTGEPIKKMDVYALLVRNMFNDQISWIRNHNHVRQITADNAVDSLEMAITSQEKAIVIMT